MCSASAGAYLSVAAGCSAASCRQVSDCCPGEIGEAAAAATPVDLHQSSDDVRRERERRRASAAAVADRGAARGEGQQSAADTATTAAAAAAAAEPCTAARTAIRRPPRRTARTRDPSAHRSDHPALNYKTFFK